MKRVLALLLSACLLLSLCACGKSAKVKETESLIGAIGEVSINSESSVYAARESYSKLDDSEQAEVENYEVLVDAEEKLGQLLKEHQMREAISLYDVGDFCGAIDLFKTMDLTEEITNYIQNCNFQILADYIFKNGTAGDILGEFNDESNGEGYYIEDNGIVIFVKPSVKNFDYIQFGQVILPESNLASTEFRELTLKADTDIFSYTRMLLVPANFSHSAEIELHTYQRDSYISFDLNYSTSVAPSFSASKEEIDNAVRDSCNELLDAVSFMLRRMDCGVTLTDLGFIAYE